MAGKIGSGGENGIQKVSGGSNRNVQTRRERADGWTMAKRATFLGDLAATCNVAHATRMAGMSTTTAYALRQRNAAFAAAWDAALEQGYAQIEAKLLARTLGQAPDPACKDAPEGRPFDPELALRVLEMARKKANPHRAPRGPRSKRTTIEQVEASLARKLDALTKRPKGAA